MRQHFILRHWVSTLLMVALVCLSLGLPGRPAQAYQSGNLLQNPGFEGEYVAINGDTSLRVAPNWQPWSLPPGSSSSINARPEYKPAPPSRVRSGSAAQEYNTFFATHTGGVYQRVPVPPNTELQFSVFVYVWSSGSFANPDLSEDPNDVIVNVGIDPSGGTDGTSDNIVWSSDAEFYDEYRELSVIATSQGTAVTVFVRSAPQGFVGTSNIYLDDAALGVLGEIPPTEPPPPPTPTATFELPAPTQEGTVTPVPATATPILPTPTPTLPGDFDGTVLYTVVAGDTVWDIAQRFNSSADAIIQLNGLNSAGLINVGQTLTIPIRVSYSQPPTFTPVPPTPAAGATSVPTPSSTATYTVLPGDTLYGIALHLNTTVATLAQINNIVNPNLIFPGQVLQTSGAAPLPTPTPVPSQVAPTPVPPPAVPGTHVVQPGENLFRIALQYNMTWDVLARANGIFNPNLVFPGQRLVIP
jgi:LysM repeat protein